MELTSVDVHRASVETELSATTLINARLELIFVVNMQSVTIPKATMNVIALTVLLEMVTIVLILMNVSLVNITVTLTQSVQMELEIIVVIARLALMEMEHFVTMLTNAKKI